MLISGLVAWLAGSRTPDSHRVVDQGAHGFDPRLYRLSAAAGASQKDLAAKLGITPQAVSKAIQRSGSQEERNGRQAAALRLRHARLATDVSPAR